MVICINRHFNEWVIIYEKISTSFVIREIPIKTIMRCHFTPTRLAKINKSKYMQFWQECRITGTLTKQIGCALVKTFLKVIWHYLMELENVKCECIIPLLGIYPRETLTFVHHKSCNWMPNAHYSGIVCTGQKKEGKQMNKLTIHQNHKDALRRK